MTGILGALAAAGGVILTPVNLASVVTTGQGFRLNRNGTLETRLNGVYTNRPGQWTSGPSATIGDAYEVRLDSSDGWTLSVTNTWLALSSNREWFASGTPLVFSGTLRIRRAGTTNPLISVAVSVTNT